MIGICNTAGDGYWTTFQKPVAITHLDIAYLDDESLAASSFGELRVYFDESTWDCSETGLIYTDKLWLKEFRSLLVKQGFSLRAAEAVEYSEQGMQGDDFVSLDIGDPFIVECDKFLNFVQGGKLKIDIGLSALE